MRYLAGVEGVDIGGDWYDVLPLDDGRLLLVIGDVSGRGLRAATVMASLRYAIHAYAAQGDAPDLILTKLSKLLDVERDGGFATVLCGTIDVRAADDHRQRRPPPARCCVGDGTPSSSRIDTGVPVGVDGPVRYESVEVTIPPHANAARLHRRADRAAGREPRCGFEPPQGTPRSGRRLLWRHLLTEVVEELDQDRIATMTPRSWESDGASRGQADPDEGRPAASPTRPAR